MRFKSHSLRENIRRSLKLLIDAHASSGEYPTDKLGEGAWRPSLYRLTRIFFRSYQWLMNIFIKASKCLGDVSFGILKGKLTFKRYELWLVIFFCLFIWFLSGRLSWRWIIGSCSLFFRFRCS